MLKGYTTIPPKFRAITSKSANYVKAQQGREGRAKSSFKCLVFIWPLTHSNSRHIDIPSIHPSALT